MARVALCICGPLQGLYAEDLLANKYAGTLAIPSFVQRTPRFKGCQCLLGQRHHQAL